MNYLHFHVIIHSEQHLLRITSYNVCYTKLLRDNVFQVAKDLGYWDGKETFKFWKAYSGEKPFSIREYYVLSTMAPSLGLKFDSDELPFSVKVDKKVNIREINDLYKETYDGTEYVV